MLLSSYSQPSEPLFDLRRKCGSASHGDDYTGACRMQRGSSEFISVTGTRLPRRECIKQWTLTDPSTVTTVRRMAHLHQRVCVSADKTATVRMLVDTGATFSVIPKALARALGITHLRRARVSLANGQRMRVDAGIAVFGLGGREAPSTVLVADIVEPILGAETLDALGLALDLRKRRIRRSRPYGVRL